MRTRGILSAAIVAAGLVALTGCAGDAAPVAGPPATNEDVLPQPVTTDELVGTGLVLQREGEGPVFCLGKVGDSAVPSCQGPQLIGWDWASAEQSETLLDATWGEYAVRGTWDGLAFTVTGDPIPRSMYDAAAYNHPRGDPDNPGSSDEAEALRVLDDIAKTYDSDSAHIEVMAPINGYTWVQVIYDDGSVEAYLDEKYGPGVVAVASALRPVS